MPRMRNVERSPGPSYPAAKPTRKRCGRESHHSLQCLPSANPSPCRVPLIRARRGMRETMLSEFARARPRSAGSWKSTARGSARQCQMEEAVLLEFDFPSCLATVRDAGLAERSRVPELTRNNFDLWSPLCKDNATRRDFSVFVSLHALSDVDRESRCSMKKKMDRHLAA